MSLDPRRNARSLYQISYYKIVYMILGIFLISLPVSFAPELRVYIIRSGCFNTVLMVTKLADYQDNIACSTLLFVFLQLPAFGSWNVYKLSEA